MTPCPHCGEPMALVKRWPVINTAWFECEPCGHLETTYSPDPRQGVLPLFGDEQLPLIDRAVA